MKKVKVFSLSLLALFLMFFILISIGGVGVSAYTYRPDKLGHDFTPHKNDIVFVSVVDEEGGDYWNGGPENPLNLKTDFSPEIEEGIRGISTGDYGGSFIITEYGLDGMYWNPWYWFNYISQFDYGIARSEIFFDGSVFGLLIVEEPLAGYKFEYDYYSDEDWIFFKPNLRYLKTLIMDGEFVDGEDILESLEQNFGQDFDGYLYWNFEEKYWQIEYYNTSIEDNDNNDNIIKEVDMVTDLLDTLSEIGAGIGDLFGRIVESVGQFFYVPGTGDTPGQFTIVGILTIAAVVVSLSMWVLRLILRLFKLRG
jgi:hypothetical protein